MRTYTQRQSPATRADPVLGIDEGGDTVELGLGALPVERKVVGVDERLPGLEGRRHPAVLVPEHPPEAGAVVDVALGHVPLEDPDLRGVEREPQALVGDLEPRLDPAPLLVLRDQLLVGELGEVLAGARAAGQVQREPEQEGDREPAPERHLRQEPPVARERQVGRGERQLDALVEDRVDLLGLEGLVHLLVQERRAVHLGAAYAHDDGVVGREPELLADEGREEPRVEVFRRRVAVRTSDPADRRVDGESRGLLPARRPLRRTTCGAFLVRAASIASRLLGNRQVVEPDHPLVAHWPARSSGS